MKRQVSMLYKMMLGIVVLLVVSEGQAQNAKVNIPFNFTIGAQRFPAGEYVLKPLLQHTTLMQNERGRGLTNIATNSVESKQPSTTTKLVFNRYYDQYFLSQIWDEGNNIGRQLMKSPAEIEMIRTKSPPGEEIALNFLTEH
jgi:hypothetical protein